MDDAHLLVEVDDGLGELPEDECRLVLLEEALFASVVKEVPLAAELSHDVDLGFSLVLLVELHNVGMMALLQNANLTLEDLPFVRLQFAWIDDFQSCQLILVGF